MHLSGETTAEFEQVKCNYPSWPWAKDSQHCSEARAKHKWVRPSPLIPSEELLFRQPGAPEQLVEAWGQSHSQGRGSRAP